MRICLLSDFKDTGGAAVASNRLAIAFQQQGHDIHRISSEAALDNENPIKDHTLFLGRKHLVWQQVCTMFDKPFWAEKSRKKELCRQLGQLLQVIRPEVVNIHNLHGEDWPLRLIDISLYFAPVIWTLHDCMGLCAKYCPSHSPRPSTTYLRQLKYFNDKHLSHRPANTSLGIATPSLWMAKQAQEHGWSTSRISVIHNPHPLDVFTPINQKSAREALGLPQNKTIILLASGNLSAEWKGGQFIEEILTGQDPDSCFFLFMGNKVPKELILETNFTIRRLGFIRDDLLKAITYSAADVLLHPAPIDNFPNTVAESVSCGTPVLAFQVGGIPEMVVPELSGWLTEEVCAESMGRKLRAIIKKGEAVRMRKSARKIAEETFNMKFAASAYSSLFERVIEARHMKNKQINR